MRRACPAALLLLSPLAKEKKTMRCLYRETIHKCGDTYLDVDIYPVYEKQRGRGPKRLPTSEVQDHLNKRNSQKKLVRLLNTNFTKRDIRFDLTYSDENLPSDVKEAQRLVQNFFRRLKYMRRKLGLPELRYVMVTEYGEKKGRLHHHIVMSGGIDINVLAELWGLGYTTVKPLQFDDRGLVDLATYLVKESALKKLWSASRNLKRPEVKVRDGKISAHRVGEWALTGTDSRYQIEAKYPGYRLVDCLPYINEVNGGVYLALHLVRIPAKKKC